MQQTMQKILPTPPPPPPNAAHRHRVTFPTSPSSTQAVANAANDCAEDDKGAKRILKETVDAVVNSFAKHTREFGRGKYYFGILLLYFRRSKFMLI